MEFSFFWPQALQAVLIWTQICFDDIFLFLYFSDAMFPCPSDFLGAIFSTEFLMP